MGASQREAILDRGLGCFVGLAVGDALGTTLEFSARDAHPPVIDLVGGGPFELKPGEWTDDTGMRRTEQSRCHGAILTLARSWREFGEWPIVRRRQYDSRCTRALSQIGGACERLERSTLCRKWFYYAACSSCATVASLRAFCP